MTEQLRIFLQRPTLLHSLRDTASHWGIWSNSLALPSFPGHWFHNEDTVMEEKSYQEIVCALRSPKMRLFPPTRNNLPTVPTLFLLPCHTHTQPYYQSIWLHIDLLICISPLVQTPVPQSVNVDEMDIAESLIREPLRSVSVGFTSGTS